MSVKGSHNGPMPSNGDIIRTGVLKKLKTGRKKFFVLRAESPDTLARLEYYDNEKKFRTGLPPKRCIPLKTCFNINKKQDTKHKNVIALYTKDDCFCVIFEAEEEMKVWLKDFLTLQHGEEIPDGEDLKPKFEYVWQVTLCERGLGAGRTGLYRICLTDKTVTLIKIDEPIPTVIELSLASVRSCGNIKNFFFLEVGRLSEIGAGEIWFETEDTSTALNIQTTVSTRFKRARQRDNAIAASKANEPGSADLEPKGRIRSASDTETSKQNAKKFNPIMSSKYVLPQDSSASESTLTPSITSANSSSSTITVGGVAMNIYNHFLQLGSGKRRHSISGGGANWSSGGNHQRTQSLPLATPVTTAPPTTTNSTVDNTTTISLTGHQPTSGTKKVLGAAGGGKCSFRERCESMPSRPRTTSEGNHAVSGWGKPYLVPYRTHHLRDSSHSPPAGSPISPPSDSTGSSYSLPDDHDGIHEMEHQRMYSTLTPDEVIAEEDYPESPRANPPGGGYVQMNFQNATEDYMEMSEAQSTNQSNASNSASMSSVTSGTPSTDMRLSDYPLDKVFSYVSADDDDTRPCRAYSVGSKPPHEPQLASTPENARVRAFSVGSKSKKYCNRVLPPHHHVPGVKSSSAPLLAPNTHMGSSFGSINHNPMDYLMVMDFSVNDTTTRSRSSTNASGSSGKHSSNGAKSKFFGFLEHLGVSLGGDKKNSNSDGYVDMKSGPRTTIHNDIASYVDMSQGQRSSAYLDMSGGNNVPPVGHINSPYLDMSGNNATAAANNVPPTGHAYSPYVDMSGNHGPNSGASTPHVGPDNSPYMDMSGSSNAAAKENYMEMPGSSPVQNSPRPSSMTLNDYIRQFGRYPGSQDGFRNDYVDMNQRNRTNSNSSSASRGAISPGAWTTDHHNDYLDMSGRNSASRRSDRTNSFSSQVSSSPHFDIAPSRYEGSARDAEGYVQMTPNDFNQGPVRHQRQSSTDSTDNDLGDYLNMSGMNMALSGTKTEKTARSQPIAIQTTSGNTAVKNSSPVSISSLLGRKPSPTGGSPRMHLPLSPYSSLPRQKSPRKTSSQTSSSKDSSVSSSVTTTPSNSSTMFPMSLNSPTSPLETPGKSGTPTSGVKVPASVLNVPYKSGGMTKKTTNEDYMMMDFETSNKLSSLEQRMAEESPYMNYCPSGLIPRSSRQHESEQDPYLGDYAIMKPGVLPNQPSTLPRMKSSGISSGLTSPLANHLSSVGISDRQSMCFMPIRERDERMCSPKPGDVPDTLTQDDNRETANMEVDAASATKTSNSEQIKVQTPRPASTTGSEKTTSRPSSVCSEGLASRLGSNSSVYSSSSSTSTVVGVSTKPDQPIESDQVQHHVVRLHYASLDLSSSDPSEDRKSPRTLKAASSEANLDDNQTTTFVYADIDFIRSEELSKSSGDANVSSSSSSTATVKN